MKKYIFFLFFLLIGFLAHAQFVADFENGNLDGWTQYPENTWSASSATGRISGNFSLRHASAATNTTDYISAPIATFVLNEGNTTWRFRMKYNNNPTATNKWAIVLMADSAATKWPENAYNGYAIGVNQKAGVTDKLLCFYAIIDGTYEEIIKTTINWNTDIGTSSTTTVSFEISRSAAGEWDLKMAKSANFEEAQSCGTATDARYLEAKHFGAINTYTSASSGGQKLWLDDIVIRSSTYPSKIAAVAMLNNKSLLIDFTEPLRNDGLQTISNYTITKETVSIYPQRVHAISPTQLQLDFAELLLRGNVILDVKNLRDANGNIVADSKNVFVMYYLYGDIVINEIMAAPAPAVELPEVSYIELYNRLDIPVSLTGWKMEYITASSGNVTSGNIVNTSIPAFGYLILCASSALDAMREYGNATSVSYISSLTKSGKTLALKNGDGTTISRVTYSDKWITDETKSAGGWSLEKIDVNNLSEAATNWAVSADERGGTPGERNSVQATNPDREPPYVVSLKQIDEQTLQLTFNELFDTTKAQNPLCYRLSNGIGNPEGIVLDAGNPMQVTIRFSKTFTKGLLYNLIVYAPFCDLAGNMPNDTEYVFGDLFTPAQNDIIINEVLFNPYTNGVDFVEIYNRSNKIFDLQQLKIANRDKDNKVASIHTVAQQYFLQPRDYAVFTSNLEAVRQFYSVPFPEKAIMLSALPSYPNDNGCVVLLSNSDEIVDEFLYSEKMHSRFIANPKGISLERVNPDRPTAEVANWQSAAQDAGFATPTYRNSQYNANENKPDNEFSLPYDTFSPDGDGYNDVLFIDYQLNASGYVATITIYDLQGRLVKELEKKTLLGTSGRFAWDGSRHDNRKAAPGIYVIYIELYDLNGNIKRIKKSCALAMRK